MSSSSGDRSPKRSRLNSYSPASPASADATAFIGPHTPPPSVRMSPSWQSQQSNPLKRSHDQANSEDVSFPTPPSTAGLQSQSTARSVASEGGRSSEQQTPATEPDHDHKLDGDGDSEMIDSQLHGEEVAKQVDADDRRTDHDRHLGSGGIPAPVQSASTLYKVSAASIPSSRPHASQNVFELYRLSNIQNSVARKDPVTGQKINKLRKSYEGKLKMLGLEGKNKAQANQKELEGLSEEAWDAPGPDGRTYFDMTFEGIELGNQAVEQDLMSMLSAAFTFDTGRMSTKDHEEWKNYLGLDDLISTNKGTPAQSANKPALAANVIARTSPAAAQRNSAPVSPANPTTRPDRANKKRRYDDSSFEGYDDDGYSTGGVDDRRRSGSKRPKRQDFSPTAASPPFSSNNNVGNMVGVRGS